MERHDAAASAADPSNASGAAAASSSSAAPTPAAAAASAPHVSVAVQLEDELHGRSSASRASESRLPFGAVAPRLTPEESLSARAFPSASVVQAQAAAGRTPPPPLPEYQVLGRGKAVGVRGVAVWAALRVFNALEFAGEVVADFLGLYDSKYQYVIDAHERHRREVEAEKAERARLRREEREARQRAKSQQQQQQQQQQAAAELQAATMQHTGNTPLHLTPEAAPPDAGSSLQPADSSAEQAV